MKEIEKNNASLIDLIKVSLECIKDSKKKQKIYFIVIVISILIGVIAPEVAIGVAIPGIYSTIKLLRECYNFKKTNKPRCKYMKKAIADMLENESLEESLNIDSISIIPSNVSYYDNNLKKCVVEGDYIIVSDDKKNYVIRKYYNDCIGNFKVEVLNLEDEEDMSILESDAPNVCENIKQLRLK